MSSSEANPDPPVSAAPPEAASKWARLRPGAMRTALALAALVVLYLAFETGRYTAGYSIISASQQHSRLSARIGRLQTANRTLEARVAELQTVNAGHQREDQVVTRTLSDLQGQIARQAEKLAFYRGVVAEGTPPIGIRIGEVHLTSGKLPLHFAVGISLLRASRPDGNVSGTLSLSVDGQGPAGSTLSDRELTGSHSSLSYQFRYYQQLTESIVLPPGFKPLHLTVTARSDRKNIAPLVQTYPWSAISGP